MALTPEQIAQLSALGGAAEREERLRRQLAQLQALRDAPVPRHTTGLGGALGGLGSVLGTIGSHLGERKATRELEGIGAEREAARSMYAQAMGAGTENAPGLDFAALFSDEPQTAQQSAAALAEALRGQRQLALAGLTSADPVLSRLGASLLEQSGQREQLVGQAGKYRLERTLAAKQEAAKNERELAEEAARNARELEEQRLRDLDEFERNKELERIRAGRSAAQRAADRAEDQARTQAESSAKEAAATRKAYLEGYQLVPEAQPSDKEIQEVRRAQAGARTMEQTIGEIERLYRAHGTEALPTEARARMAALTTDLQMSMKGPEMYGLGVITGPDLELLRQVVPDPTNARANVLDFLGGEQTLAKLRTLRGQVARRFENSARSLGYRRHAAPAARPSDARVIGGKTYRLNARGKWEEEG